MSSRHAIGIHGYVIVYSVTSRASLEMAKTIRDKILNHTVRPLLVIADVGGYRMGSDDLGGE